MKKLPLEYQISTKPTKHLPSYLPTYVTVVTVLTVVEVVTGSKLVTVVTNKFHTQTISPTKKSQKKFFPPTKFFIKKLKL